MSADKNNGYKFIEEKIKPEKKRIIKENIIRAVKVILYGILFGAAATGIFVMILTFYYKDTDNVPIRLQTATPMPEDVLNGGNVNSGENSHQNPNSHSQPKDVDSMTVSDFDSFDVKDYSKMYAKIAEYGTSYNDTVVTVAKVVEGKDYFSNPVENSDSFSGLVVRIDKDYIYVLTEYDGIDNNCNYQIVFNNGEKTRAGILGRDKVTGLAVIYAKLEDVGNKLLETVRTALIGSSDGIKTGALITAIGNPAGNMYSVTYGMVTGNPVTRYMIDRQVLLYHTNMQNLSSCGGVIMNTNGQVAGIITHRFDEEDESLMSFIGISQLDALIEQLINNTNRTYLGVLATNITEAHLKELDVSNGIYVTDVVSGSPAMGKGLVVGDVISKVNDKAINSVEDLTDVIAEYKPGDKIDVTIYRTYLKQDKERVVNIELGDVEDMK